ncbi:B12-binding domain-containing radical SAM protein [Chloroflexota bacterium]
MRIVFIHPDVGFNGHTWEATGIGYVVAYLRKHYMDNLDIEFYSGFYDEDDLIVAASRNADIIGFSCTSPQYKHGLYLARQIKTRSNRIVFGGVHPSVLPEQVLREDCIDAIIVGEGEEAMLRLVNDVAKGLDIHKHNYRADYINNLDNLPFPDRKTIKNERNIQQAFQDEGIRITSVLSSRGCPFQCSFCCSHALWQRKVRFRSPSNILDEIEQVIADWDIQLLKFSDDNFTVNKSRVIEFCRLKIERGVKIPYGANAHVNTMDEELIKHLAESGCQELWYGVESGSPRILKEVRKHTDIDKIKAAFKLTKEYGIKTRAYFLLGIPSETSSDIEMTERLCDELQPDIVSFFLVAPYPTNEYFDFDTMSEWDWSTFDEYGNDWVHTQTLSNKVLKDTQERLVEKYQDIASFRQRRKK